MIWVKVFSLTNDLNKNLLRRKFIENKEPTSDQEKEIVLMAEEMNKSSEQEEICYFEDKSSLLACLKRIPALSFF